VAPLVGIIEWAQLTRRESVLLRGELSQRSQESASASGRLAEGRCTAARELERAEMNRRVLPEWPAWAPPDPELLRTLVRVD
jgi:hypothetical protein